MNENLNLIEKLKNVPKGTKFQVCGSHSDDEGYAGYDGYGDKVYQHYQYNPITGE